MFEDEDDDQPRRVRDNLAYRRFFRELPYRRVDEVDALGVPLKLFKSSAQAGFLSWDEVEGVQLKNGVFTVRKEGKWFAWSKIPFETCPTPDSSWRWSRNVRGSSSPLSPL